MRIRRSWTKMFLIENSVAFLTSVFFALIPRWRVCFSRRAPRKWWSWWPESKVRLELYKWVRSCEQSRVSAKKDSMMEWFLLIWDINHRRQPVDYRQRSWRVGWHNLSNTPSNFDIRSYDIKMWICNSLVFGFYARKEGVLEKLCNLTTHAFAWARTKN